jgi:hypothetical protein
MTQWWWSTSSPTTVQIQDTETTWKTMKSIFLSANYPSLCPDALRVPTTRRGWEKTRETEEEQQEVLTTFMLFLARIDLLKVHRASSRVCRSITVINCTGKLYASWQLKTSLDLENLQRISETYRHHNNNITIHKCISQSVSQSVTEDVLVGDRYKCASMR